MRRSIHLLAVASLCVAPMPVSGRQHAAVSLRMKFKPGETARYRTTLNISMAMAQRPGTTGQALNMPMAMTMIARQDVLNVLPAGGARVKVTMENSAMTFGGQSKAITVPPMTMVFSPRGNVRSVTGLDTENPMFRPGGGMDINALSGLSTYLPAHLVRPGDIWSQSLPMPTMFGAATGQITSTFARYDTVGRYRTALIHSVIRIPLKFMISRAGQMTKNRAEAMIACSGTWRMTQDTDFAVTEGKAIRTTGRGTGAITMNVLRSTMSPQLGAGAPQHMSMRLTMSLETLLLP